MDIIPHYLAKAGRVHQSLTIIGSFRLFRGNLLQQYAYTYCAVHVGNLTANVGG